MQQKDVDLDVEGVECAVERVMALVVAVVMVSGGLTADSPFDLSRSYVERGGIEVSVCFFVAAAQILHGWCW